MPIVYGKGGCIRYMEVREQPLYDPDSLKEKAPPKCRGSRRGRPSVRARCVETGEEFGSYAAAAMSKGTGTEREERGIGAVVRGERETCLGLHWARAERGRRCSS